ncbi:uncharacterized protein LOC133829870 [Humulus lupulus]|uniref:uncharacterized protein LOC133829870 n=1 Tax=Humulus lupulus TaxID=3486 RepID=UPI002B40C463|nr:uncharacterized protein LOC133829870 [Humulus lupulus]
MSWNVRGLNTHHKQREVKKLISYHKVGLIGLLETRVKAHKLGALYLHMFSGWCFTPNNAWHNGGRIVADWNPIMFSVSIIKCSSQLIHLLVRPLDKGTGFYVSFVYGFNAEEGRVELWKELYECFTLEPWLVLGDFNDILHKDERIGVKVKYIKSVTFQQCIEKCNLEDVKSTGSFFTWTNKQQGDDRIYSKIDRVLANQRWLDHYTVAEVIFLNEGIFDHYPAMLSIYPAVGNGKKPFRYFKMWASAPDFFEQVQHDWQGVVFGTPMYRVVRKLKRLKTLLKELNRKGFNELQSAHIKAVQDLKECQDHLKGDLLNERMIVKESQARKNYSEIHKLENRLSVNRNVVRHGLVVNDLQARLLLEPYSMEEVKQTVFSIPGIRAPGLDGYCSYFFQDCWDIIGADMSEVVLSFLHTGSILKEINATTLTLIPKSLLQGLKLFSKTSGLFPSEEKSAIYCGGMDEAEVQRILEASCFQRSSLPFRYLGVPICAKKNSAMECSVLLEKMTGRIRRWSTRNLFFVGRIILINSVLISIHSYWSQLFLIPKRILKEINAICRAFLWHGTTTCSSPGGVAWERICRPKRAGGLGFRNILAWNKAALGKYVWAISSKKDDLWVKWINSVYIKEQVWWDYSAPMQSSWYWRKIVAVKDTLKSLVDEHQFSGAIYSIKQGYDLIWPEGDNYQWSKEDYTCLLCGVEKESVAH